MSSRGGRWAMGPGSAGSGGSRAGGAAGFRPSSLGGACFGGARLVPFGWPGPIAIVGAAGVIAGSCAETLSDQGVTATNLNRQRQGGWSIGGETRPLVLPGAVEVDAAGGPGWKAALPVLADRLAPAEPRWQPFYMPTLFQSLQGPRNADLRALIHPIYTAGMATAFARGQALLSLFSADDCPPDVALVLDLPGPDSVAVAAAVAPCFDPVFVLDNWPHPAGVVPSHLALGAALYYLPVIEDALGRRPPPSPPVFVLDRSRLAAYADEASQFDNRYLARLPSRDALQAAGIRHVLYVTQDQSFAVESDDLNGAFLDFERGQLDVRMLAMSDFQPAGEPTPPAPAPPPDAIWPVGFPGPRVAFFYGGSAAPHSAFRAYYGWQRHAPPVRGVPAPPARITSSLQYHPAVRAISLSRGVGLAHASVSKRNGTLGRIASGGHGHGGGS